MNQFDMKVTCRDAARVGMDPDVIYWEPRSVENTGDSCKQGGVGQTAARMQEAVGIRLGFRVQRDPVVVAGFVQNGGS